MNNRDWLEKNFEETRSHLNAVAYRMLGTNSETEDVVQEAWIRLNRSESDKIENLSAWLTTVVARICLDILRTRKSKNEESLNTEDSKLSGGYSDGPETNLLLNESVGSALLVVLDLLSPSERLAFVLHDLFDLSFKEISTIIDCSVDSARQLASRARRRVRGSTAQPRDCEFQKEIVSAFLAASREGNFESLIKLLHPDVILNADETAIKVTSANKSKGAPPFKQKVTGAANVANTFKGKAAAAQLALINGSPGATWGVNGKPVVAFCFTINGTSISSIEIVMDKKSLEKLDIEIINNN